MLEAHHKECDREVRGEDVLLSGNPQDEAERNQLLDEMLKEMLDKAGGKERWVSLPGTERLRQEREVIREAQISLGERVYQRSSPEEKEDIDFWVYTGRTMVSETMLPSPIDAWNRDTDVYLK